MHMATDDLDLADRSVDTIGLYLHPPQHAAVFCIDQKAAFRIPEPLSALLSAGVAEHASSERNPCGTLALYAAFDLGLGEVPDYTASRHSPAEFLAFLADLPLTQPHGKEIHVLADNLEAHRTVQVNDLLRVHQTVHLHLVPTYLDWLVQVERWLSRIERDIGARSGLHSGTQIKSKLMRRIRQYHNAPKILKWKYFDPAGRLTLEPSGVIH
jgi:DDE superfamily endonuclease